MKKFGKTPVLVSALCVAMLFAGCMGGGGGGGAKTPVGAPDAPAITQALHAFMKVLAGNDLTEATNLFSSRLQVSGQTGQAIGTIKVFDFGSDIKTGADDVAYTFTIPADGVVQPSPELAIVTAVYTTESGTSIGLVFNLVKEQGLWLIDQISYSSSGGGTTFSAASFFPLQTGNVWNFARESVAGTVQPGGFSETTGPSTTIGGKTVYTVTETSSSSGTPVAAILPNGFMADLFPGNEGSSTKVYRYSNQDGLLYYGPNDSFNGGIPWQMLPAAPSFGGVYSATMTFTLDGTAVSVRKTVTVGTVASLSTGLRDYAVLPVTIDTQYLTVPNPTGHTAEKTRIYLATGMGIVGGTEYDTGTGQPDGEFRLVSATINGVSLRNLVAITPATLPTANLTQFQPLSATVAATGGTTPYSWTASGTLPTGVSFLNGAFSGTPTEMGSFPVEISVRDKYLRTASAAIVLSVVAPPSLAITTAILPSATLGQAYSTTVAAAGGTRPYTWSVTTILPGGLTNAASGDSLLLSGTPTVFGSYQVGCRVSDAVGQSVGATFPLIIADPLSLTITTAALPVGTRGLAYSGTIGTTGGTAPFTWTVTGLPPGVTGAANVANYDLSGTPTSTGSYTVNILVSDSATRTASTSLVLSVVPPSPMTIDKVSLIAGVRGVPYSETVTTTGGAVPLTWSVTGLPAGLTGVAVGTTYGVSGTPTATGTFTVDFVASDTQTRVATKSLTLTIADPVPVTIANTFLATGTVSVAYNANIIATGGIAPHTWTLVSGAPTWLTINGTTGVLSGTPDATGTHTLEFSVSDSGTPTFTGTKQLILTILPAPLVIQTASISPVPALATVSIPLQATGGQPPYTWSDMSVLPERLPVGLNLEAGGVLRGAAALEGTYTFTAKVTDSQTPSAYIASKTFTFQVIAGVVYSVTKANDNAIDIQFPEVMDAADRQLDLNYEVRDVKIPKAGLLPDESVPIAIDGGVSYNTTTNVCRLAFTGTGLPKSANLTVRVRNVRNSTGTSVSDGIPRMLGNTLRFFQYIPWTTMGLATTPAKIKMPAEDSGKLFVLQADRIVSYGITENTVVVGGTTTVKLDIVQTPQTWFDLTTSPTGTVFKDVNFLLPEGGSTFTQAIAYYNVNSLDSYISKRNVDVSGGPAAGSTTYHVGPDSTLGNNPAFFDLFDMADSAMGASVTVLVRADNDRLQSQDGWGLASVSGPMSVATPWAGSLRAYDSFLFDPSVAKMVGVDGSGNLRAYEVDGAGSMISYSGYGGSVSPLGGAGKFGLMWLQFLGYPDEFLVADGAGNAFLDYDGVNQTTVWMISNPAGLASYRGRLNQPFGVSLFISNETSNGGVWYLVADADGLQVFRWLD